MSFDNLRRDVKSVDGMIYFEELELLYNLGKDNERGCIVEIGNYRGKSTLSLAYGSKDGVGCYVYTIDPHKEWGPFSPEDRKHLLRNLLEFDVLDVVKPLEIESRVPAGNWEREIGLLWIDGDHSYEGCKNDVENWVPHVLNGGLIAFHDYDKGHVGVSDVVDELLEQDGFEDFKTVRSTKVVKKINE